MGKGDNSWVLWIVGGVALLWYLNSSGVIAAMNLPYGETAVLPPGPTVYPNPISSVQAGGQYGYIATLNQQIAAGGIQSYTSN